MRFSSISRKKPVLKTEEGYSADIYPWKYMSLEIYVRTMSPQCPHNISLVIHISFVRCRHISPGIYVRTMSALHPSSVFSSGFFLEILENLINPRVFSSDCKYMYIDIEIRDLNKTVLGEPGSRQK